MCCQRYWCPSDLSCNDYCSCSFSTFYDLMLGGIRVWQCWILSIYNTSLSRPPPSSSARKVLYRHIGRFSPHKSGLILMSLATVLETLCYVDKQIRNTTRFSQNRALCFPKIWLTSLARRRRIKLFTMSRLRFGMFLFCGAAETVAKPSPNRVLRKISDGFEEDNWRFRRFRRFRRFGSHEEILY